MLYLLKGENKDIFLKAVRFMIFDRVLSKLAAIIILLTLGSFLAYFCCIPVYAESSQFQTHGSEFSNGMGAGSFSEKPRLQKSQNSFTDIKKPYQQSSLSIKGGFEQARDAQHLYTDKMKKIIAKDENKNRTETKYYHSSEKDKRNQDAYYISDPRAYRKHLDPNRPRKKPFTKNRKSFYVDDSKAYRPDRPEPKDEEENPKQEYFYTDDQKAYR